MVFLATGGYHCHHVPTLLLGKHFQPIRMKPSPDMLKMLKNLTDLLTKCMKVSIKICL